VPKSHQNAVYENVPISRPSDLRMHIGGFNFNKNLQQSKGSESTDTMSEGSSILKEINKNTSAEHFKVSKKHKFGHAPKKPEPSILSGEKN
jgi:hypothetical protein